MWKDCEYKNVTLDKLNLAVEKLKSGNLVIFPTETVYGLGADATNPEALKKIYRAKGRPLTNPLILHVSNLDEALRCCLCNPLQTQIVKSLAFFWPGPLTLVLPASSFVSLEARAGLSTVGVRIPNHPVALALIQKCGFPVAAPSANRSGRISATHAKDIEEEFPNQEILVLESDPCEVGVESTIVEVTSDGDLVLLRRGFISPQQITQKLEELESWNGILIEKTHTAKETELISSPGQFLRHYSPEKNTYFLTQDKIEMVKSSSKRTKIGVIDFNSRLCDLKEDVKIYFNFETQNFKNVTKELYKKMRSYDNDSGINVILFPDLTGVVEHEDLLVLDKLFRACSGRFLDESML